MGHEINVTVNGRSYTSTVVPRLLLSQYLRDVLNLTGTHVGCDTTSCGACSVLLNGSAVKSCNVLAVQVDGAEVTTVEGLASGRRVSPDPKGVLGRAWPPVRILHSGMMVTAIDILSNNPQPTEAEIRNGLRGNLCRCTGYHNIVKAVQAAAVEMAS